MSRFIPPPDQINSISPKKTKKSFDENGQSIFSEIKKVIKDSFSADAFGQVGAMNAVVLEIRQADVVSMLWRGLDLSTVRMVIFCNLVSQGQF